MGFKATLMPQLFRILMIGSAIFLNILDYCKTFHGRITR